MKTKKHALGKHTDLFKLNPKKYLDFFFKMLTCNQFYLF